MDDPAGPTWLWKVADVSEMPKGEGATLMNTLFEFPEFMDAEFMDGDEDDEDEDADEDADGDDEDEDEDEEMEDGSDEDEDSDEMGSYDDSDSDGTDSSLPPLIPIYEPPVTTSLSDLD